MVAQQPVGSAARGAIEVAPEAGNARQEPLERALPIVHNLTIEV